MTTSICGERTCTFDSAANLATARASRQGKEIQRKPESMGDRSDLPAPDGQAEGTGVAVMEDVLRYDRRPPAGEGEYPLPAGARAESQFVRAPIGRHLQLAGPAAAEEPLDTRLARKR